MPGPGGGGRGGGGFGGGFGGGGFRGGSGFGGGFHRGGFYHRPFMGGFYHRPFFYGGGCLGGLFSMFLTPIILIILAISLVFSYVGGAVSEVSQGGSVYYDEETFQDYANEQYAKEFGGSSAYEDNLLLVFLKSEDNQGYCYIAWVGDHIDSSVNYLFGAEGTALGNAMYNGINTSNFKYSLDSNLAQVVGTMKNHVQNLGLDDAYTCTEEHTQVRSHLTNHTDLELSQETVNTALEAFTESTGIPMVLVVEDAADVFGKTVARGNVFTLLFAGGFLVLAIWMTVKAFRRKKASQDDEGYRRKDGYDRY